MNKLMKIGFMAVLLVFLSNADALAQRRGSNKKKETEKTEETQAPTDDKQAPETKETKTTVTKKTKQGTDNYFDESGGFKHRLWYGAGGNLGFNGLQGGGSLFSIGLTPMVGYKIIGGLSAGPRIGFTYTSIKSPGLPAPLKLTELSVGPFARFKFLKSFFIQTEHQWLNGYKEDQYGQLEFDASRKPIRQGRQSTFIGGGYNSGMGLVGYEISFMYDVSLPTDSYKQPYELRFGFNYNF
jgi:hypothetical protein